jgi:signal transduction histidine kinase
MGHRKHKPWEDLSRVFVMPAIEPSRQIQRIIAVERDVMLPVKLVLVVFLFFAVFHADWFYQLSVPMFVNEIVRIALNSFFVVYLVLSLATAMVIASAGRIPLKALRVTVVVTCLLDNLLLACLAYLTDGFDSNLFWVFLWQVVRNALSMPMMVPQLLLQLATNVCFVAAGLLVPWEIVADQRNLPSDVLNAVAPSDLDPVESSDPAARIILLALTTACCYGVQVLFERQRLADNEGREFALRNEQVKTAGRLAAEIAHQIKNPLAIINNTAWSLQRALKEKNGAAAQQLDIIREEVERSDRIITELMGYARLAEGRVEKLEVIEELNASIDSVFPPGAGFASHLERHFDAHLPTLLMQRAHLREVFTNLLMNARDAVGDAGKIRITARQDPDDTVVVTVEDNGPGIPADKLEQVFEAYYTTKPKGTGLGLAIVRNNIELYGGSVKAESVLGQGARFILRFPARTVLK